MNLSKCCLVSSLESEQMLSVYVSSLGGPQSLLPALLLDHFCPQDPVLKPNSAIFFAELCPPLPHRPLYPPTQLLSIDAVAFLAPHLLTAFHHT